MRSSAPCSYATNQWLVCCLSLPQMSHEMAWRITGPFSSRARRPTSHFIADSRDCQCVAREKSLEEAKDGKSGNAIPKQKDLADFQVSSDSDDRRFVLAICSLLAGSKVALLRTHLVPAIVAVEIDGAECAVVLEIGRRIRKRVLAAQFLFDLFEAVRHLFHRGRKE